MRKMKEERSNSHRGDDKIVNHLDSEKVEGLAGVINAAAPAAQRVGVVELARKKYFHLEALSGEHGRRWADKWGMEAPTASACHMLTRPPPLTFPSAHSGSRHRAHAGG